ncbi:MAG: SWIM zinc finger family protein [Actinobacteria bacterium]|nr:SWIM zinc finger family protein [Actinomycetota bacterium]
MAHSLFVTPESATVRNPGVVVDGGLGQQFLDIARTHWRSGPGTRGRPYAQNGSIMGIEWIADVVSAQVAGSSSSYLTVITGVPLPDSITQSAMRPVAHCTCPYGARSSDWCKHAVALAYACAALLDGAVDDQTGRLPGTAPLELDQGHLNESVRRLANDDGMTAFDPEAAFAHARRWLDLPPIVQKCIPEQ